MRAKMKIFAAQKFLRLKQRLVVPMLIVLSVTIQGIGCSEPADDVRPNVAKETLITALTAWKNGDSPPLLQEKSPAIVVQDMDWTAGAKLQDFQLQGDGKSVGANLSIEVELTLVDAAGASTQQKVWYLVGTDPALTVFRDMLH